MEILNNNYTEINMATQNDFLWKKYHVPFLSKKES